MTIYVLTKESPHDIEKLANFLRQWPSWEKHDPKDLLYRPETKIFASISELNSGEAFIAVLIVNVVSPTSEIIDLYVAPSHRKKGHAYNLLCFACSHLRDEHKVAEVFLEVRPSNLGAISLYEKIGFARISLRKNYYSDSEDAFVFRKDLIH